jgi:hypothetical protein
VFGGDEHHIVKAAADVESGNIQGLGVDVTGDGENRDSSEVLRRNRIKSKNKLVRIRSRTIIVVLKSRDGYLRCA